MDLMLKVKFKYPYIIKVLLFVLTLDWILLLTINLYWN